MPGRRKTRYSRLWKHVSQHPWSHVAVVSSRVPEPLPVSMRWTGCRHQPPVFGPWRHWQHTHRPPLLLKAQFSSGHSVLPCRVSPNSVSLQGSVRRDVTSNVECLQYDHLMDVCPHPCKRGSPLHMAAAVLY